MLSALKAIDFSSSLFNLSRDTCSLSFSSILEKTNPSKNALLFKPSDRDSKEKIVSPLLI